MDRVTKPQKKMLVSLLKETKYMEGKKEKEWYWEKIQAALNSIGPKKTIIQWKKCWRDMRLTTRKKLAEIKRCQTGGGSSPPPGVELTQEDNDIIDIVGSEYFYEEMGGEIKPEHFLSGFEYVPEQFCDAILSAAAVKESAAAQEGHVGGDGGGEGGHPRPQGDTSMAMPQFPSTSAAAAASANNTTETIGVSQQPSPVRKRDHQPPMVFPQRSDAYFEDKLLRLMQETFSQKRERKRRNRDPDKLFLLSMYEEIKKIPDEFKLDAKSELIQVLKKWQRKSDKISNLDKNRQIEPKHQTHVDKHRQQHQRLATNDTHAQQHQLQHNIYHLQKKYEKSVVDKDVVVVVSEQQQQQQQQHIHPQQLSHSMFQLQKKYNDEASDKVHQQQQNERKQHVDSQHHNNQQHSHSDPQQQQQQQPPPPPTMHHPQQIPHSIMFPLPQLRNDQHLQHAHQHSQQQHQQQQQHHPPPIFVSTPPAMPDRTMTYENVG